GRQSRPRPSDEILTERMMRMPPSDDAEEVLFEAALYALEWAEAADRRLYKHPMLSLADIAQKYELSLQSAYSPVGIGVWTASVEREGVLVASARGPDSVGVARAVLAELAVGSSLSALPDEAG